MLIKGSVAELWSRFCEKAHKREPIALLCEDPYIEKILLQECKLNESLFKVHLASELKAAELDGLQQVDMFAQSVCHIIFQAQMCSSTVVNKLKDLPYDSLPHRVVLVYSRSHKSFEALQHSKYHCFSFTPPAFWQMKSLLLFWAERFKLHYPDSVIDFLVECLNPNSGSYISALKLLANECGNGPQVNLEEVKRVITSNKRDRFKLAQHLARKEFYQFWPTLIEDQLEREELISLFKFFQSHLLKVADTGYLGQKKKLSSYDREILKCHKIWKPEELEEKLGQLNRIENKLKEQPHGSVAFLREEAFRDIFNLNTY